MVATLVTVLTCATACWLSREAWHVLGLRWNKDREARLSQDARIAAEWKDRFAIDARDVAVKEREIALKERQLSDRPATEPMPPDLEARCRAWDELFMQEQEKGTILGLYAECRDWDKVRQSLGQLAPAMETEPSIGEGYVQ